MGAMRVYRAPGGLAFQYREGHAPEGYELVAPEAAPKRRRTADKAARPADKAARPADK